MKITSLLLILAAILLSKTISAQTKLERDEVCFTQGEAGSWDLTLNDMLPQGIRLSLVSNNYPCFQLDSTKRGVLLYTPNEECRCQKEPYLLTYAATDAQGMIQTSAQIIVTIKCPKPDCALVNLEDYTKGGSAPNPGTQSKCVNTCEDAKATYYLPYDSSKTYIWTVTGGTLLAGSNPAQIMVAWGSAGTGSITLVISAGMTVLQTFTFCVKILDGPTASWTADDKTPCLGSTVTFTNTSVGDNAHFWDFGDGTTSTMDNPSHSFSTPGIHTVCLYVTKDNYDTEGVALCCCSDTMCMDILVDSLAGPNIYCLSTLCTGDATKYWTDAANCSTYTWTVLDETGAAWPFTGQGTPMINVIWGNGPIGTVSLEVAGCDDPYCDDPVSITVPIIPATVIIGGPAVVCAFEPVTYTVPKWLSADYVWEIMPLGTGEILSGQGTNTVVVQWFGSGMIMMKYTSDFLSGLPGQNPLDCEGSAKLNVDVKPRLNMSGASPVCVNTTSTISTLPPANCTWTISPAASFTGQSTGSITANWTAPGSYLVTAVPLNPADFCNPQATTVVQVVKVPKADSISGPTQVCLNQPYTYIGYTSQPGLSMTWNVVGGTFTSSGNSATVTWISAGSHSISLVLNSISPPVCPSDPVVLNVTIKELTPLPAIGGNPACLNATASYSTPAQPAGTEYEWTISPLNMGSVVSGQGTPNIDVQWNNTPGSATLTLTVKLCGSTLTRMRTFVLQPVTPPTIAQAISNCAYVLTASGGLPPYAWLPGGQNTASITVTTPGIYTVSNVDINGCPSSASVQISALPGPMASISTGNATALCLTPPATVTLTALTGVGYSFVWHRDINNAGYTTVGTGSTLTHSNSVSPTNVLGNFKYFVVVTNSDGCTAMSNVITITHNTCPIPPACTPINPPSLSITNHQNQSPNCANVAFTTSATNVTITGWNFGDMTTAGAIANPTHTYTTAGCYHVEVYGTTPAAPPNTTCPVTAFRDNVCVPMVADFSFTTACLNATFTDQTTFLTGQGPSGVNAWAWNFGGTGTSSAQNPTHIFPSAGTYNVTLTVQNAAGCTSSKVIPVTVAGAAIPGILINGNPPNTPPPYCAGAPLMFDGTGAGITSWLWNFGTSPAATNTNKDPEQSFAAGTYTIMLTGTNAAGCSATSAATIVVRPVPALPVITASSQIVCAGATAMFSVSPVSGHTYLWSPGGGITPSITVGTAGAYSVAVTNSFGCSITSAPVTLTVRPAPPAVISGNPVICDNGCITLSAPLGSPAYTYEWQTGTGGAVPLPNAFSNFQVCASGTPHAPGTYQVVVKDSYGCTATSPDVTVTTATPPSFFLTAAPDDCEGVPVTLTLSPVQPNVAYSWSNGGTGSSTVVTQAGSYQAVGVDTLTGCSFSASISIHPLPDLCLTPAGCYEVCNPDTICGPAGLSAYQWNKDGVPISGATNQCLIVTQAGTYSLTGTTAFGCTATSDSLMLMVIPCDPACDSIIATAAQVVSPDGKDKPCCFNLNITNLKPNFFTGVNITVVSGGTLPIGNVTDGAGWDKGAFINGASVTMEPDPGSTVPVGSSTCAQICVVPNGPVQEVLVEFLDITGTVLCDTTFLFECEYCISIVQDTITCDTATGQHTMTFCVHVSNTNSFNVNAIVLMPQPGVTVTPSSFSLPNLPPDSTYCDISLTATITLADSINPNNICIGFTAHEQDVTKGLPPEECCMIEQCFDLPQCCPHYATAAPVDTVDGKCCWKITLHQPPGSALSVTTNLVPTGSGITFDGVLPPVSPWVFAINSAESITWQLNPSGPLPALIALPTVCFDVPSGSPVPQLLEVQWASKEDVLCRDTLAFSCAADTNCVAVDSVRHICVTGTSGQTFTIHVTNPTTQTLPQTPFTATHVAVLDVNPPGSVPGSGIFPFTPPLAPGMGQDVGIPLIGAPGTVVCFSLNLLRQPEPGKFEQCCYTEERFCVKLLDCLPSGPQGIFVYPNPTRGHFTLAFGETGSPAQGLVRIRDVAGRLLGEEAVPAGSLTHEVQMPGLSSGLYFVEFVENGARIWAEKLSVVR